ncbi:MAG: RNA polymerase sigma factor FliA [Pseudomonadota bacterium]
MVLTYDAKAGLSASASSAEALVREHAPLVKRIALHLRARLPDSVLLDDLMQAGMIGLLEAARSFDPTQGASFSTFAGIRIRGAIIDEIRRGDWAPRSVHKAGREIARTIAELENRYGREVADGEVAAALNLPVEEYHRLLQDVADTRLFSLEALEVDEGRPVAADQDRTLAFAEQSELLEKVTQAISELPERERLVLNLYYTELLNLKEIGAVLEVSESRVSQIMSQATLRLRARLAVPEIAR